MDESGNPRKFIITDGVTADCTKAVELINKVKCKGVIGDKGYDTDSIIHHCKGMNKKVVIPPRKSRNNPREYDKEVYKRRHLVENAFLKLKRWRGIATRYAKNSASFMACVFIRLIAILCENFIDDTV